MKILFILLLSLAFKNGDFREKYSAIDTLEKIDNLVYNHPVKPLWSDKDVFIYENSEAAGKKYYIVNVTENSKTEITKERFETIKKGIIHKKDNINDKRNSKPILSPNGKYEAFIRDSNVWLRLLDEKKAENYIPSGNPVRGNEMQLSFNGTEQYYYTELHWSPDSKMLACMQREYVKVRQIPLRESAPEDQIQPKIEWIDYAKPGDLLPQAEPVLFDIENMTRIAVDMTSFDNQYFLQFGKWHPDSGYFTFEYNRRGHQLYQLVAVERDGKTRIITEERSETFIYYYDIYRHYMENGDILWISERDDWRHLYYIESKTGNIRKLTEGNWNVRNIYDINEEKGYILFSANGMYAINESGGTPRGEDPYNLHLMKLEINSGKMTDLTPEAANHIVEFNEDHTLFTDVYSKPDFPAISLVRNIDGKILMKLQEEDITDLLKTGWTMPEVFVAKGRDGNTDIWGTIFRPSNFSSRKKYPVVEYIYAGPHDSFVLKDFYVYTRFQKLLELGFIVVTIDGMGTDNRSKSFQDVCWRNLKDSGFPDRILWIKAAAKKYKSMDISNVGIYGYSAGGQSTLQALLHFNDFYKVGVSLCGCHDNRMDKIWWNEQWMGYPIGPWYSENSTVDNAYLLKGKLLIINGEMDNNVDPASSLQVVKALIKADKDFEQLYLPGYSHNLGDKYVTRKIFEFFYKNIVETQHK